MYLVVKEGRIIPRLAYPGSRLTQCVMFKISVYFQSKSDHVVSYDLISWDSI